MANINKSWCDRRTGKKSVERQNDYRSPFMRDECRVVHSFGFRRLQGKTQILGPEQGDFQHNRMTHSIEVASICRSIAMYLKKLCSKKKGSHKKYKDCLKLLKGVKNDYECLITAIGLLHDIGHPPFGHGGEVALNFKMREHGGFEGNAQTLRLLTDIEDFTEENGLDLTRRTLLGLIKYPASYSKLCARYPNAPSRNRDIHIEEWLPPKCYYDDDQHSVDWLSEIFNENDRKKFSKINKTSKSNDQNHKKTLYKSFDCSIMDIADDIAYSIHDIEDAIHLGLIKLDDFRKKKMLNKLVIFSEKSKELYKNLGKGSEKRKWFEYLFDGEEWKRKIVFGGMMTVMQLFDAIIANPDKLLPDFYRKRAAHDKNDMY